MLCVKCATPNPPNNRFCSTCGENLHTGGSGDTETGSGVTKGFISPTGPGVALSPGSILGGRYRILDEIGSGGMGRVYKALDLELEVPVALKVIRPEYASADGIVERFKKEITIARKVTHRNVARIYDFGDAEGVKYISMEYLEGQDLARIIERDAPLPIEKIVSILRQCCAALSEAHAMGIVHRDLKPHNVMIDAAGDVRLMDFGIAMSQESKGLTRTGAIVGTPEYMSPEQAEGKKVDHRSDIYSLGITIYEALTGVVPFSGSTQWEVIRRQIQDRVRPPRKLRAEIPAWIETMVLKCLEKDPGLRYQSADEILRDIDRQKATRAMKAYAPKKRTLALAAGAAAVAAAAVAVTLLLWPRGIPLGPGGRTSLAVLPFENQTGRADLDWLRTGLAENLSTDLAQSRYFRVLTRERLSQILRDLGRAETAALDAETLARVGEYGGVQAVITGSFVGAGDALRINLRAQDPDTGEGIGSAFVSGREVDVLAMIDQLTLRTKEILSVSKEKIAADVDTAIASARTSSVEAASLFQKGVDLLQQGRNLEAVDPLLKATTKDPDFALAYARLSQAYRQAGYDEKAREAGDKALTKVLKAVDRVTPADRAFIRAAHAAASHEGQDAIEAYDEMVKADPFDPTAAYNLGLAYEGTGEWDKAEVFFRKARDLDPKYALAEVAIGRIKIRSGHPDESLDPFRRALEMYRAIGSKEGEATAYQAICNAHKGLRQWEEALTFCGKSAAIKEAIGDKRGLAASLGSEAYIYQVTGRLEEALSSARKSIDLSREIGDLRGTAAALTNLASLLEDRGDLREAFRSLEEALEMRRPLGDQAIEAELLDGLGRLRLQLGEMSLAGKDLTSAADLYQRLGIEEGTAQVTSDRGLLALASGDLKSAEGLLSRAASQWEALESPEGVSETRYRQAMVALRRGLYGTALTLAGQALADYEKAEDKLNTARCRAVLGIALLRAGDPAQAAREIDAGMATALALGNPALSGALEATRAEIHLKESSPESGEPLIRSVCQRAASTSLPGLETSCALLKGFSAIAGGRAAEAASLAAEAASRSSAKGLRLEALDAASVRVHALAAAGDPGAAAAGITLVEQAGLAGVDDIVARAAPVVVAALARAGKQNQIPPVAAALIASLQAIRKDLPPGRTAAFLDRGIDAAACRGVADQLRRAGREADARSLEALLTP